MNSGLALISHNRLDIYKYFVLSLLFNLLIWISSFLLISDNLYFNAFAETLSYERIEELIEQTQKWGWATYVVFPILLFMKTSLTAICLGIGYYFIRNRFSFILFFNISLRIELVFLLPILTKLVWFLFFKTGYSLQDISLFYPLSAINMVNVDLMPRYWIYPLQTLNLFEIAYWFLLAYGVADATGFSFKRSFGLVMSSYGVGLVLWVVLVMFLTVTYS